MFCPNCGFQCSDDASNCPNCNARFNVRYYEAPPQQRNQVQQPVYFQTVVQPAIPGRGLGIAAMVCGIIGFFVCVLGIVLGSLGAIFGAVGYSESKAAGYSNGMAISGIVLGMVSIFIWGYIFVFSR